VLLGTPDPVSIESGGKKLIPISKHTACRWLSHRSGLLCKKWDFRNLF